MSGRALAIIPDVEPAFARAQRLQAEARGAVADHIDATINAITRAVDLCAEVATGGELYPAAVRDRAKRLADQLAADRDGLDIAFQSAVAAQRRRP